MVTIDTHMRNSTVNAAASWALVSSNSDLVRLTPTASVRPQVIKGEKEGPQQRVCAACVLYIAGRWAPIGSRVDQ